MAEKRKKQSEEQPAAIDSSQGGGTATAKPKKAKKPAPKPTKNPPGLLPPYKVLLHNDDKNAVDFVIGAIVDLTPLNKQQAEIRTVEADKTGVSLLLVTHKERAELYQEQFESKGLTVSIEPAE